ncbi:MAG: cysteine desulfurase NifS [Deltaproteobacteria bacterium]|nr:cysteine desulfurase NifS [Deltaproteobacteria bacterium]
MKTVYMDNNATTKVDPQVLDAMLPYFTDLYGNPSSMHLFGGQVGEAMTRARRQVADLIGADPSEILFTSCGTESNNTAIRGTLKSYPEKHHIVTTRVEHPAVLNLCRELAREGCSVTELPVDRQGELDLDQLRDAITPGTAIVSVMYANNETGVIFPVEEIAEIVHEKGAIFHCDAVQAVGKVGIDMAKIRIDLLAISGHKLHASKGIGVLYVRKGTRFRPFLIGGHQEQGRRGGTENVPSIIGLGRACVLAAEQMEEENRRVRALRDRLEQGLLEAVPYAYINGHPDHRLPNTTNISFEYIEGEGILLLMSREGIAASSGSACTSGSLEPSHVLRAMGVPYTCAHGSIRFSLSRFNTEEEVDYILEKLPFIISRLRELSPYWKRRDSSPLLK